MSRHVIRAHWLVGLEEDVGGLAGGNHHYISDLWCCVASVDGHHCQIVISYLEEELVIECSVDYTQKIGLSLLDFELVCS